MSQQSVSEDPDQVAPRINLRNLRNNMATTEEERWALEREEPKWPEGLWQREMALRAAGHPPPLPRLPVIISKAGPITSSAALQTIAELDELPELFTSYKADYWGGDTFDPDYMSDPSKAAKVVRYCCVLGFGTLGKVKKRTKGHNDLVIWLDGERRNAWQAYALKDDPKST